MKHFIGFYSLEKLLASANRSTPINAMPVVQPGKGGKYGITINTQMILVAQVQPNGEVLYCRIITGRYQALAGSHEPLGGGNYAARSESAWTIVKEEITNAGFQLREAVMAMPTSLCFLDGHAECLKYNKETDLYERRAGEPVEVQP